MVEVSALQQFLERALCRRKDRYLDFIARPKSRGKFLEAIYHELEYCFDASRSVKSLPAQILDLPALRYKPPKDFGVPMVTLREAFKSEDESFLAISLDGTSGIFQPETFRDSRLLFHFK
ncbi:hypothetical protein DES53_102118 [Roseimicrobium gellanilyticum]|uniref:Uncharacterized protein n=1 Tax=Roseimicrobium gellanilyticum TaxID=748857 RepID=A0A366HQH7_9BACT|nr:hypothetical protein [Roseimicrobium gellanilyticum]RBP45736.1 hypothetical protein DES53_102118 [Roseimicrobium gellanilyticum]